ncbi:hypothetical protein L2K70_09775 [Nocardioides KLBMP 9356]|uniref:Uncharacterized protein n=1 Tax=Nocardioides potassii TaxID=2911371 RepID=A0ABS9HBT1_9ACTN|nr:hypothetical protein [Nocardioides potassii]MCF6377894.1 hypothetical protein [Nocardioides potassii]
MRTSLLALPLLAAVAFAGPALAATTVAVNEASLGSTWSNSSTSGGTVAFGTDFAGVGALQLNTPGTSDKAELTTTTVAGAPLSTLSNAAYRTYRAASSTSNAVQTAAIKATIDFNGAATGGYAVIVFEPVYNTDQGAVVDGTWQSWQAGGDAKWWSTRAMPGVTSAFDSFVPLSTIIAENPAATITALTVGTGSGNAGLLAGVDSLTVGETTYDFGPRAFDKADCKGNGWATNFTAGTFVNQGDCVSFYASAGKTHE